MNAEIGAHERGPENAGLQAGQGRAFAVVGPATFAVSYVLSAGCGLLLAIEYGTSSSDVGVMSRRSPASRDVGTSRYWGLQLIPIAGPFLFAGSVASSGYAAFGLTILQVVGAITLIYGLAGRPRSPCGHACMDPRGLTLRF